MTADKPVNTAAQESPPKNTNDMGQSGDDAPVFVGSVKEYRWHLRAVMKVKNANPWHRIARSIMRFGGHWFLGFAVLYALLFAITGSLFPQLYQAWLDLCLPLAEYVGGLTPRAERIMTQLADNGYPERADDALHGIAIARVLMVPAFFSMVAGVYCGSFPFVIVSCTLLTRIKIWLLMLLGMAVVFALLSLMLGGLIYIWEYVVDEGFEGFGSGYMSGIKELLHGYHRGNLAMMVELLAMGLLFLGSIYFVLPFAHMRAIRFIIVKQPPGDKP